MDFIQLDKHVLSLQYDGRTMYLGAQKGRLLLSTTKKGLDQMLRNEGTPWIDDGLHQLSTQWPLVGEVRIPPMMGMMIGGLSGVEVGVRSVDDYVVVALDANFNTGQNGAQNLLRLLAGQPEFQATEKRQVESYTLDMMKISANQHQVFARDGAYLPVGLSGQMDSDVDYDAYVIPDETSAVEHGWISEPSGSVYWVELTEDGFLVHALVTSDGVLLHFTKDQYGKIEQR
jgi:hypothetical protein